VPLEGRVSHHHIADVLPRQFKQSAVRFAPQVYFHLVTEDEVPLVDDRTRVKDLEHKFCVIDHQVEFNRARLDEVYLLNYIPDSEDSLARFKPNRRQSVNKLVDNLKIHLSQVKIVDLLQQLFEEPLSGVIVAELIYFKQS